MLTRLLQIKIQSNRTSHTYMSLKQQQPQLLCNQTSVYIALHKLLYLTFSLLLALFITQLHPTASMKTSQYQYRALKGYSASATNHLTFFSLTIERQDDIASVQQGQCPQIEYFAVPFQKLAREIITIKLESNSNLTSQIRVEPTIYVPEQRCSALNKYCQKIYPSQQ